MWPTTHPPQEQKVQTVEKDTQQQDKAETKVASEMLPANNKDKKDKSNKVKDQEVRCCWQ